MPTPSTFQTFRDPAFSLWQSAIHATLLKQHAEARTVLPQSKGLAATAEHPYMAASVKAISELQKGAVGGLSLTPRSGVVTGVLDCAKLAAEIAWDELFAPEKVPALKNELAMSTCDPFWAECLAVYEAFHADKDQPYTVYTDINQYVLGNCFPDSAKIAIIGDWGTGMGDALVLLQQIATNFKPDVLIHLGDIYYAGLVREDADNFSALINEVWPENAPLVFTLDGNHDRYAGSKSGYFPLIAGLNKAAGLPQPNSYFALRNNFWQFLAMDTGYHDVDPFTVTSNVTYLEQSEIEWHLDKIKNNGANIDASVNPSGVRGTVLLSHHQLMSFTGVGNNPAGAPLAVNPNLAGAFAPVFDQVDFWLWGHEHDLCIFEPYTVEAGQNLPAGRCVGASAVPVFPPQATATAGLVIPSSETGPPQVVAGTSLGNNGAVFNHCYAIVTLNDAALSINYYQFDSSDATPGNPPPPTPLAFADNVTAPRVAKS
jgi:hypothetical protein